MSHTNHPEQKSRRERSTHRALTLPPIDLEELPRRVDRPTAAAIITAMFGPVSPRSLERWPVRWVRFNGRATADTAELVAEAARKFAAAPAIRGGRQAAATANPTAFKA